MQCECRPFFTLDMSVSFAQSPGGVSPGLTLWLKADAFGTLSSTDSLNSWQYSNNSNVFTATTSRPILQSNAFNFSPGVAFFSNQFMDGPNGASLENK